MKPRAVPITQRARRPLFGHGLLFFPVRHKEPLKRATFFAPKLCGSPPRPALGEQQTPATS